MRAPWSLRHNIPIEDEGVSKVCFKIFLFDWSPTPKSCIAMADQSGRCELFGRSAGSEVATFMNAQVQSRLPSNNCPRSLSRSSSSFPEPSESSAGSKAGGNKDILADASSPSAQPCHLIGKDALFNAPSHGLRDSVPLFDPVVQQLPSPVVFLRLHLGLLLPLNPAPGKAFIFTS